MLSEWQTPRGTRAQLADPAAALKEMGWDESGTDASPLPHALVTAPRTGGLRAARQHLGVLTELTRAGSNGGALTLRL